MNSTESSHQEFNFIPEYADLIAHIASSWATLEYYVADSVWVVAGLKPAMGACVTAQIFGINGKLSALLSLLKLRSAPDALISKVNKFSDAMRGPQERRNRIIHDVWLINQDDPSVMGRLELTAPKKLSFKAVDIRLEELKSDFDMIAKIRKEFHIIRAEIYDAVPKFPEIPKEELHPIMNVR